MEMKIGKTREIEREVSASSESFDITANVRVVGDRVTGISSGTVKTGDGEVANFSYYGNVSVNFSTSETATMTAVIEAINAFVASCSESATTIAEEGTK